MKEKIISEINLDLVFQCNDFSQFSNKLKDTKTHLIFESIFWEKVFLSWINTILKKEDYELPNYIFEKKSFSFKYSKLDFRNFILFLASLDRLNL